MPTVDFYSKGQTDTLLSAKANTTDIPTSAQLVPSTSGASQGDVLSFNGSSTEWSTPSGGGDGWEDVDLSQAVTFADGDELEFELKFRVSTSLSVTSWTSGTLPSAPEPTYDNPTTSIIIHIMLHGSDAGAPSYSYVEKLMTATNYYYLFFRMEIPLRYSFWNATTGTKQFYTGSRLFNATGSKVTNSTEEYFSTFKNHIGWMRRKHHN